MGDLEVAGVPGNGGHWLSQGQDGGGIVGEGKALPLGMLQSGEKEFTPEALRGLDAHQPRPRYILGAEKTTLVHVPYRVHHRKYGYRCPVFLGCLEYPSDQLRGY